MRIKIKHLFLAVIFCFILASAHKTFAVDDAIVAVVNSEIITLRDLREYIRSTYVGLVAEGYSDDKIKKIMLDLEINGLNKLIEDKLILSKANETKIEVRPQLVDDKLNSVKSKYASEQTFEESLVNHGVTLTDLRNKIEEQLKVQFAIDHFIRSKLYVNPKEVTEYYQSHLKEFQKSEQVVLNSIFILKGDNPKEAQNKANQALEQLKANKNFDEVAKEFSKAPPLGKVEKGQLKAEIEQKVFQLQAKEISPVIEVDNGFYIFLMKEKIPPQITPLEEVKNNISNFLYNAKTQERYSKWVEDLKEHAYIEIKK